MMNASPVMGGYAQLSAGPVGMGGRRRRSGKLRLVTKKRARAILRREGLKMRGGLTQNVPDSSFIQGKGDDTATTVGETGPTGSYANQAASYAGGRRRRHHKEKTRRRHRHRSHRRSRSRTLFGLHY